MLMAPPVAAKKERKMGSSAVNLRWNRAASSQRLGATKTGPTAGEAIEPAGLGTWRAEAARGSPPNGRGPQGARQGWAGCVVGLSLLPIEIDMPPNYPPRFFRTTGRGGKIQQALPNGKVVVDDALTPALRTLNTEP
jgi:hypothetical protein